MNAKGALVAVVAFVAGAMATAGMTATGWRIFATSSDSATYGVFVSANATTQHPQALGVRVTGDSTSPFEVRWFASCQGTRRVRSGTVVRISVPLASSCSVQGTASGDSGKLRLDLLRR